MKGQFFFKDVAYPPRFATLEAAHKALKGDFSGMEVEFKLVEVLGHQEVMLRDEYKNARYEMKYIEVVP